jgi:hypothetical protein
MREFGLDGNSYVDWQSISGVESYSQTGLLPDSAIPVFRFLFSEFRLPSSNRCRPRAVIFHALAKILEEQRSRHQLIGGKMFNRPFAGCTLIQL